MGRRINTKLTKDFILSKVDQITIFSTYFNLPIETIQYCIDTGEFIVSPIRTDLHPTCGFRYNNRGKLKFKDFAGYFWGDCFDAAAYIISNIQDNENLDILASTTNLKYYNDYGAFSEDGKEYLIKINMQNKWNLVKK